MTAINLQWGPLAAGAVYTIDSEPPGQSLNDADNCVAWSFMVPKTGTITKVGFWCVSTHGSPPQYKAGLVVPSTSNGYASGTTVYGGCALTDFTPTADWNWITMSTPASAVRGDMAAVKVMPSTVTPTGTNYIKACAIYEMTAWGGSAQTYAAAWTANAGNSYMAVEYDDGTIYGLYISDPKTALTLTVNGTPDEAGALFTVPTQMTAWGAIMKILPSGSQSNFLFTLYDANDTVLHTSTLDKDIVIYSTGYTENIVVPFTTPVNFVPNSNYRFTVKPTYASTGGDIAVAAMWFASAAAKAYYPWHTDFQLTQRTDSGVWTDTELAIPIVALLVNDMTFSNNRARRLRGS